MTNTNAVPTDGSADASSLRRSLASAARAAGGVVALAGALGLLACGGDATGPTGGGSVSVAFTTASTSGSAARGDADASVGSASLAGVRPSISVSGTNGTLTLETAHLVVTDFELERADGTCDDSAEAGEDDDDCEEFEADPQFLDLSLDGGSSVVVSQTVPPGTYTGLEFEADDLEDDDEDAEARAEQELLADIREQFAEWPQDGSLRVTGTFTPDGADQGEEFTAYFEAEIEIEKEFPSPMVIEEDAADKTVTLTLAPSVWFTRADGSVVDLTQFHFPDTGEVGEFEVELEDGVTEVEIDG